MRELDANDCVLEEFTLLGLKILIVSNWPNRKLEEIVSIQLFNDNKDSKMIDGNEDVVKLVDDDMLIVEFVKNKSNESKVEELEKVIESLGKENTRLLLESKNEKVEWENRIQSLQKENNRLLEKN